jgi:hypothetical protein
VLLPDELRPLLPEEERVLLPDELRPLLPEEERVLVPELPREEPDELRVLVLLFGFVADRDRVLLVDSRVRS